MPIHPRIIEIIRSLEYDPDATRSFEWTSGAFVWSDEEFSRGDRSTETQLAVGLLIKKLIAYRSSLIGGKPDESLEPTWREVQQAAPNWPGFRPERRHPDLREPLQQNTDDLLRGIDRMGQVCQRAERMAQRREQRRQRKRRLQRIATALAALISTAILTGLAYHILFAKV